MAVARAPPLITTSSPQPAAIPTRKQTSNDPPPFILLSRRHCFTALTLSVSATGLLFPRAQATILEADDDEELLERVKKDRQKRIQRQGVINSSKIETGYLQDLIYKLSKVGQAIEKSDISAASSVLGSNTNADWVQNANSAFTKLSSSPEEKTQVDTFLSSLSSLFSSVAKQDVESSKVAFVSSATALEKWISLTGLVGQLKGL
ncbi:putative chloroplast thylakoid lumenal protein MPH2 [Dioscorea sansibarensis]